MTTAPVLAADQLRIDRAAEKELTRKQSHYRNYANHKYERRSNDDFEERQRRNQLRNLEQLRQERHVLRTKIAVATGRVSTLQNDTDVRMLQQHIVQQELLQQRIDRVRQQGDQLTVNLQRLLQAQSRLTHTVPNDRQHGEQLRRAAAGRLFLENRLDAFRRQEGAQISANNRLRELIAGALHTRQRFSRLSMRTVRQLSHDKKFLLDAADRAVLAFIHGAALCERLDSMRERNERDRRLHAVEMLDMCGRLDADGKQSKFLAAKGRQRELVDLEPREYGRRELQRAQNAAQLVDYGRIIARVVAFQGTAGIPAAIEKFRNADAEYFAHFNYMNMLGFQIEFLGECQRRVYAGIDAQREYTTAKRALQLHGIAELKDQLRQEHGRTARLRQLDDTGVSQYHLYMRTIGELFGRLGCDRESLDRQLGDQRLATEFNVIGYLAVLESRLNEVLNYVYHVERASGGGESNAGGLVVRGVQRSNNVGTHITDVVLVQQCAECAEGDVNRYDEKVVWPMERPAVLAIVREKTVTPEIQYRLHRLSKCRLPRSRALMSKRFQ